VRQLFDDWPETYDQWFATPIGRLVKRVEGELLFDLIRPNPGDLILDAGCGTGVFTLDLLHLGCHIIGIDLSMPMLLQARQKAGGYSFRIVLADLLSLPFSENSFDKVISVTALEFIEDGRGAIDELFRVTKKGGSLVVATLNSLSPWAEQRKAEARQKHTIFEQAIFRSPEELLSLTPIHGEIRTAVHFRKEENPELAPGIEQEGSERELKTGAFVAARWMKP
jgi:ubiquinone/menaquinone biosynthesis C-methylase UbiE